ncbi:MAG: ketoacyl-ACP synthase III [Elusimicrobiota bacterium]|jgi:3-oxoacyl-[acyl-carrier-protein] synthase-3|nr:ketoacyl-ACP synthase III [Elusimicrobiota bacterium]
MNRAKIISIGHYTPKKILTNTDLEKMVDTNDEWITQRTGIKERHIARIDEMPSDMGYEAAKEALEKANINPEDIDIILCGTVSGDYITPATACLIQAKLGAKNAFAFDISAACSGFIYGLSIAEKFILADNTKTVLVVATEKISNITNWEDRATCVLFGDGAGAAILKSSNDNSGIVASYLKTDGDLYDYIMLPGGGSKNPASLETVKNKQHYLTMKGNEVFKYAVTKMIESVEKVLVHSNWTKDDVNMIFPHQANIRIIDSIRKKINFDKDRVFININKYGNTSAATIPIAVSEALQSNKIKAGDKIVLVSFGSGFTWGALSLIW